MNTLRIVPLKDTAALQTCLELEIKRRFPCILEKRSTSLWYLKLPDSYEWQEKDADFMNYLADNQVMLAGWAYQDYRRGINVNSELD